MRQRSLPRLLVVLLLLTMALPFSTARPEAAHATGAQSSGIIPWHAHFDQGLTDLLSARVDLSDGHLDVAAQDIAIPFRGPGFRLRQVWDSTRAAAGLSTWAGQGGSNTLTRRLDGVGSATVSYTDETGASWVFSKVGVAYVTPPGLPYALNAGGNQLTNFITGDVSTFAGDGHLFSYGDAYGNTNFVAVSANVPLILSGRSDYTGRRLLFGSTSGLLTSLSSPWYSSSAGAEGQRLTYAYSGAQRTGITWGAGTADASTATLHYGASNLLDQLTTPAQHLWGFGYDASNRLTTITSPISGTVGQPGYTPSYITRFDYSAGQTVVTRGYGTAAALVTTYSIDAAGRATAIADGLGHTRRYSYDANHDLLTSQDGAGNTTTATYTAAGPSASFGLPTEIDYPQIHPNYPGAALAAPVAYYAYNPTTYDLTEAYDNAGRHRFYGYDAHHSVTSVAELLSTDAGPVYHWRGRLYGYDSFGELTSAINGRGVRAPDTTTLTAPPAVTGNDGGFFYTTGWGYDAYGNATSRTSPQISTTLNGATSTARVVTGYAYNDDDGLAAVTTPNNQGTAARDRTLDYYYDHLGRPNLTALPNIPVQSAVAGDKAAPQPTDAYDGDGNITRHRDGNMAIHDMSYDPLRRLVSDTNAISGTTTMTYSATNLVSMRDPMGQVTTYQYDAAGRRTNAVDAANQHVDYGYDAADNLTGITRGDGIAAASVEMRTYNALNLPETDSVANAGNAALTSTLSYSLAGNLVREQHPNGDVTFNNYDLVDQLVAREIDRGNPNTPSGAHRETFGYDKVGNPTQEANAAGTPMATYTYDATQPNELRTLVRGGVTTSYAYDGQGNPTSISGPGSPPATLLWYDALSRFSTLWRPVNHVSNYDVIGATYNATGQRAFYTFTPNGSASPTYRVGFTYRPDGRLGQATVSGLSSYTDTYLYRQDGSPLELIRVTGGVTARYWYVLDGRRNVVALTDITGAVVDTYSYERVGQGAQRHGGGAAADPLRRLLVRSGAEHLLALRAAVRPGP